MTEFSRRQQQPQPMPRCDHGKLYSEECKACFDEWKADAPPESMSLEDIVLRAQRAADFCRANPGIAERYASVQLASLNYAIASLARRVLEMRGPIQ